MSYNDSVNAIKTAFTQTLNDIKTSFSVAVYGRLCRHTFRLWRNVVNRHKKSFTMSVYDTVLQTGVKAQMQYIENDSRQSYKHLVHLQ